jgi:glyoxylase-like metal-dependent hydrolase (beta-lactamase superfamily II)
MWVNNYLVWDTHHKKAVVFDTGADVSELLAFLSQENLSLETILLTHTHGDHVFELDRLCEKTGAHAFVNQREPLDGVEPFETGRTWNIGTLVVTSRLTCGHSNGGTSYVIHGLDQTVAVVGDALFASSMGGAKVGYAEAIQTNQEALFTLSNETVLCPGHGPLTTVGWEKRYNPFFAGKV